MNEQLQNICQLMTEFIQLGYAQAVKAYEPQGDLIRTTAIQPWLRRMQIDPKLFRRLLKAGLVKSFKTGDKSNSPLYYSKEEIRKAISMARTTQYVNQLNIQTL